MGSLGADCRTPVAAFAVRRGDALWLRAMAAEADGSDVRMGERKTSWSNDLAEVRRLGEDLGHELLRRRAG
jgi:hydroxymethylbilane synthase